MGLFTVLVNGAPKYTGGTVNFNGVTIDANARVKNALTFEGQASVAGAGVYPSGNNVSFISSTQNGTISFYDATLSTFATANLKSVNFIVAASTFAQTATITNGPRAANPVAWLEVTVGGSSGRIPVW